MAPPPIIPKALQKGDTIAWLSPSFRFNKSYSTVLTRASSHLESLGFHTRTIFHPAESVTRTKKSEEGVGKVHDIDVLRNFSVIERCISETLWRELRILIGSGELPAE